MKAFKLKTLVFAAALVGSASAMAGSATATMTNTTTIPTVCSISAQGFTNNYDPVVANTTTAVKDATASVTYTCTNGGTGALISLSGGNNDTGTSDAPARHLTGAEFHDLLAYNLYSDTNYQTVWGYGAADTVSAIEDGAAHTATVYTQIPAGQNFHADTYSDTVTATITF
ncbi:spore coat U domain-containing protein [Paraburkholderia tagetis]|uniref:Spore coat U domain-containing protein n=1 Tax=Paraburkholderia tagetis TaxID=2913261 RepID=A0A9X1RY62_9BURK|nr:spore coat U domain-containing protein [Paraburkholderia tagetis]MCG5077088.1 spore coat U domain-containing protein [Paraburkholderia tagetis]